MDRSYSMVLILAVIACSLSGWAAQAQRFQVSAARALSGRKLMQNGTTPAPMVVGDPVGALVVRLKAVPTLCLDFRSGDRLQVVQLYNCDAQLGMSQLVQTQGDSTNPDWTRLIVSQNLDNDARTKILEVTVPFKPDEPQFAALTATNGVSLIVWEQGSRDWRASPAKSFIMNTRSEVSSYQLRMAVLNVTKCIGVIGGDGAGSIYLGILDCDTSDARQIFTTASGTSEYLIGQRVMLRAAAAPNMCWDTGSGAAGNQLTLASCQFNKGSQVFRVEADTASPGQLAFTQDVSGSTRVVAVSGNALSLADKGGGSAAQQSFALDATADFAMGFKVRISAAQTQAAPLCVGVSVSSAGLGLAGKDCNQDMATVFGISALPESGLSWLPNPLNSAGNQLDPAILVDSSLPAATFTQPGTGYLAGRNVTIQLAAAPFLCWDVRAGGLLQNVNLLRCDGSTSQLFTHVSSLKSGGISNFLEQASGKNRSIVVANPATTSEPASSAFGVNGISVAVWDPSLDTQFTSQALLTATQGFQLQPAGVQDGYLIVSNADTRRCVGVSGVSNTGLLLQGLLDCRLRDPRQVFKLAPDPSARLLSSASGLKEMLAGESLQIRSTQYAGRCWDAGSAQAAAPVTLQPCVPGKSSQAFVMQLDPRSRTVLLTEQASGSSRQLQLSGGQLQLAADQSPVAGSIDLVLAGGGYQFMADQNLCISVSSFNPSGADGGFPLGLQECNNGRNVSKIFMLASSNAASLGWTSRKLEAVAPTTPADPVPVTPDVNQPKGIPAPSPTPPSSTPASKSGVSNGVIIGAVVGGVALLLLLLLLLFICICRRRRRQNGKPGAAISNIGLIDVGSKMHTQDTKSTKDSYALQRSDSSMHPYTPTANTGSTNKSRKALTDMYGTPLPPETATLMSGVYQVPEDFVNKLAPYFCWISEPIPNAIAVEEGITAAQLHAQARAVGRSPTPAQLPAPDADAPGPMPVELTAKEVQEQVELLPAGLLGSGGAALVFKGRWPRMFGSQAYVAVKVLRNPKASNIARLIESIKHEVSVLRNCRHAHIVRIYGFCLQEPNMCIIMELLSHTLHKRITEITLRGPAIPALTLNAPPATVYEVIKTGKEIADGLAFLHTRRDGRVEAAGPVEPGGEPMCTHVLHRDLKPLNILIDSQGKAKISDFGLAREVDATTLDTLHPGAGTPSFLPPEMLLPRPHITDKVDVYSLGIILWTLGQARLPPNEVSKLVQQLAAAEQTLYRQTSSDRAGQHESDHEPGNTLCELWPAYAELARECKRDAYRHRPTAAECARRLGDMLTILGHF